MWTTTSSHPGQVKVPAYFPEKPSQRGLTATAESPPLNHALSFYSCLSAVHPLTLPDNQSPGYTPHTPEYTPDRSCSAQNLFCGGGRVPVRPTRDPQGRPHKTAEYFYFQIPLFSGKLSIRYLSISIP